MTELYKMCDIKANESATVEEILPTCPIRRRLYDVGLIKGTKVKCLFQSVGKDMKAYLVRGAVIAIRNTDCCAVLVSIGGDGYEE